MKWATSMVKKSLGARKRPTVSRFINLDTVGRFLAPSDFFTIDVAHFIGQPADSAAVDDFVAAHPELIGTIRIPSIAQPFITTRDSVAAIASKYLAAVSEAGRIYRHIESQ